MRMIFPLRMVLTGLLLATALGNVAVAQPQAVTRLEGFIQDEESGGPVGCKIYLYGPDGERIRSISSNSADGSYLMVLNAAGAHKLVLGGHNVYRKEYEIDVPASTVFQEIKKNLTVKSFREGAEMFAGVGFEPGSAVLSAAGRHGLATVLQAITDNQQLQITVDVYPDQDLFAEAQEDSTRAYFQDSIAWAKEVKAYEKKYRRKKDKPEPPAPPVRRTVPTNPNQDLAKERKAAVKAFFKDARNADLRVQIATQPLPASLKQSVRSDEEILKELTSKSKKSKSSKSSNSKKSTTESAASSSNAVTYNTLVVKVGEVKRLFGD